MRISGNNLSILNYRGSCGTSGASSMDGLKGGSATQPVNDAVKNKKIALEQEQSKRSLLPELMSNRNDTGTSLSHRNILKSDDISPTAKNAISAYLDNYKYEQRAHITQLLGFDDYA